MITLSATDSLSGVAGTASAVTYTLYGDQVVASADAFKVLAQGQLAAATGTVYPATASTQTLIKSIHLANTTGTAVTGVKFYVNGTAGTNQILGSITVPSNGTAVYSNGVWQVYDSTGALQTVGQTGATGPGGTAGATGPTGAYGGAITMDYLFDTGTSNADPGSGKVRLSSATENTATAMYINTTDNNASNLTALLDTLDASTNTVKGELRFTKKTDITKFLVFNMTSRTTHAGYREFALTNIASSAASPFANTDELLIEFSRVGDAGATGATGPTLTMGAVGASPNANAGVISAGVLTLEPASASFPGLMPAANFSQDANWFGHLVFNVEDYGVTPANTAATNVTNMNTLLQTTAPDGALIQFGSGTYQFSAGLTTLTKDFVIAGIRGQTTIAITADMGNATPFLKLWNSGFYAAIKDLNFVSFATQTTNYVIQCQNNANVSITDCFFTGASNWSGVLDFSGTNSGNGAILKNIYIANWTAKAINVSSPLDTMYIEDLEIVGAGLSGSVGLYCDNGGAMLISNSQIISADINVELNPANGNTVSSVFATNCFFDQGKTNCLLISGVGTGTVARCHFVACWFTISGTSSVGGAGSNTKCIQIKTTGTGIHSGIEFQDCWIMNATTGSTGTLEGILATAVADFTVSGCQFAGWTNDIQITPASNGSCSPLITANTFAAAGLLPTSTNGIILNAGSFTYGAISIQANMFGGKSGTANILDNSAVIAGSEKVIRNNVGTGKDVYVARMTATQTSNSAALVDITGLNFPLVQPGLTYEFESVINANASVSSSTAMGIGINAPAGATINAHVLGNTTSGIAIRNNFLNAVNTASSSFMTTSGFTGFIRVAGVISGGTATSQTGTVQVRLAVAAGTATLQSGGFIKALKI